MESGNQTNGITLLPCPFCGGEADEYEGDYGNGIYCMMCGAMVGEPIHLEYRTTKLVSIDEAVAAWNTRACCEGGAIIATEENMRSYGWVKERTCELECTIYWDSNVCTNYWEHELSCGHTAETLDKEPPSYCQDCGAKVVEQ